jgi:GxxExxY protein
MDTTPYNDLTYKIIGAAMTVHNALGPGLKEAFYQRALSAELETAGLSFYAEQRVEVHLDETRVGVLYLDHLVEEQIIVEEKALSHMLTNEEIAQVITYLCATGKKIGLLINFGRQGLEYRRILPPRDLTRWQFRIQRYVLGTPRKSLCLSAPASADSPSARRQGTRSRAMTTPQRDRCIPREARSAYPLPHPLTANPLGTPAIGPQP